MDFINRIVQVLREDLYWFRISTREAGLIEPVELWDEEQPSYIDSFGTQDLWDLKDLLYTLYTDIPHVLTFIIGSSYVFKDRSPYL